MSLIKENLVTISGNKAQLTQVGGLMKNNGFYKSLNDQQLVALLMIPTTKHHYCYIVYNDITHIHTLHYHTMCVHIKLHVAHTSFVSNTFHMLTLSWK